MVKKPFRGNYLEMKVRISYDERTDTVHLTSKDKDLPTHRGFHLTLNGGRDAEYTLRTLLEKEGLIPQDRLKAIPEHVFSNDAINTDSWYRFPLGLLPNGKEAVWTSSNSNLLIAGPAGSGKSIIERNIIFHCLRHPENWVFYGIDLLRVEMTPYLKFGGPIKGVATTLSEALETITKAYNEMNERYHTLEQNRVTHFADLSDVPSAWMIMVDEPALLLIDTPSTTEEGKAENLIKDELKYKLSKIAQLGTRAGIHLVMAAQRVDYPVLNESLKTDFTTRIAAGRMDPIASKLLLGNDKATHLNGSIKGRGYFQHGGQGSDFQGYFVPFDWPYEAGIVSREH